MPERAWRPCNHPSCGVLTKDGYCPKHAQQRAELRSQQARDWEHRADRGTAAQRGYDGRWQKARVTYLRQHPLCVECLKASRIRAATVVDHIKPHKGDQALFWDTANWQALCKPCHDTKTATEDGGFGNNQRRNS